MREFMRRKQVKKPKKKAHPYKENDEFPTKRLPSVYGLPESIYEPPLLAASYMEYKKSPSMREFESGATRDSEEGKLDYEGFLSPLVIKRYAEYMHSCRLQTDGKLRDSDNWQRGIPLNVYMKSAWRHFFDWWKIHRATVNNKYPSDAFGSLIEEALCALMFNANGYLHEILKRK